MQEKRTFTKLYIRKVNHSLTRTKLCLTLILSSIVMYLNEFNANLALCLLVS